MSTQKLVNQVIIRNEQFIETAEQLKPELYESIVKPSSIVEIKADPEVIHGWRSEVVAPASSLVDKEYQKTIPLYLILEIIRLAI